jgi:signal transduction histidine kinase
MSVTVAGREIIPANSLRRLDRTALGKGGGQGWVQAEPNLVKQEVVPPQVLATSERFESGQPILAVNVHLISPGMLYAGVQSRRFGFLALIGASVVAALTGFLTARRAFFQQLRLSDLKTNFVSSVSHELRAPIASLRLMAERLESGRVEDPTKQSEYFRFIVQECRRLGTMIENVLDFSRIERGQKSYEFEPTDMIALLENSIKVMEPTAAQREIRLKTIVQGKPLPVCLDGLAMQQVMLNLIDNAIKHSPARAEVEVGLAFPEPQIKGSGDGPSDGPSPQANSPILQIWVADHGKGIAKAEHEKIFERFYRCGSELRRTTQGVGIGLSIVKHVVEAHGGRVTVDSKPGAGSRFGVELPMRMSV